MAAEAHRFLEHSTDTVGRVVLIPLRLPLTTRDLFSANDLPPLADDLRMSDKTAEWSVGRKLIGRDSVRVVSVRETVTAREEVRPMNATTRWVLPLVCTVGR